jgi:hypothetical protein
MIDKSAGPKGTRSVKVTSNAKDELGDQRSKARLKFWGTMPLEHTFSAAAMAIEELSDVQGNEFSLVFRRVGSFRRNC